MDASAAIAVINRIGVGQLRHLEVKTLWGTTVNAGEEADGEQDPRCYEHSRHRHEYLGRRFDCKVKQSVELHMEA